MGERTFPALDFDVRQRKVASQIALQCRRYRYREPGDNALFPVAVAKAFDLRAEAFRPRWVAPFLPGFAMAWKKRITARVRQRLEARPEPGLAVEAHRAFFGGSDAEPDYVGRIHDDGQFGFNRVGGVNPTLIERVRSRAHLANVPAAFPVRALRASNC